MFETLSVALCSFVVGTVAASTWYVWKRRNLEVEHRLLEERLAVREQACQGLQRELQECEGERERLLREHGTLSTVLTELRVRLDEERKATAEKLAFQAKCEQTFGSLAHEALQKNNQSFLELAQATFGKLHEGAKGDLELRKQAIDDLLKPFKESLAKMEPAYVGLSEQVKLLYQSEQQLRQETSGLVRALRAPVVRGRWGEVQLRRAVELAGMVPYCDFVEQRAIDTDAGYLRPDLLVRLPNRRTIVVDAKCPLEAFLNAIAAESDDRRREHFSDHARLIRTHVKKLGLKGYHEEAGSVEFTVLFLPGESIFSAALEHDQELIEYSSEQNIVLATPTTLIALLKAVHYGWQQEQVAENVKLIGELGRELYERIQNFTGHLARVRRGLDQAVDAYNAAVGSFERRVLPTTRKFKMLDGGIHEEIEVLEQIDRTTRPLDSEISSDDSETII